METTDISLSPDRLDEVVQSLPYAELHKLRTAIAERMTEMRATGITQLRATIAEQAQLLGVELADLVPHKQKRRGRPRKTDAAA